MADQLEKNRGRKLIAAFVIPFNALVDERTRGWHSYSPYAQFAFPCWTSALSRSGFATGHRRERYFETWLSDWCEVWMKNTANKFHEESASTSSVGSQSAFS